uniref:Uncharacterized protein n=1 Tax=Rhizophora mucronata TaxID=61149 RepID=A0A2P2MGN9_RHIMU
MNLFSSFNSNFRIHLLI